MRMLVEPALLAGALVSLGWGQPARAVDAATIARQGNGHGATACQACHGAGGGGQAGTDFPRLAGLDAAYLRKQLDDFAAGTRENAVMQPIATALGQDERQALAGYYSGLPVPKSPARPTAALPPPDSAGALLATRGRWSAQVPACEQCHGPGGVGVGAHFPPLAGQPAAYMEAQLQAWKQGTRHNDPLDLMKHLSGALSEPDIRAVASWFAAQPLHAPETTR